MMTTVGSGTGAADEIGRLASELREDARLRDLERALRDLTSTPPSADRARKWAAVDLFAVFLSEEPAVSETGGAARFWQVVDTSVQVLVFVPIALTWLGLALAASAYRAAQANGSLRGESFLQGWQTGFHGRLPSLVTFDHVALYTFSLVFVLIVGTAALVVHRKKLEERQAELRRRLVIALTRADLELAPFRLGLPERVAKELDLAADRLNGTVGAIEAAGRVAARSQQKAADALTAVAPALASVVTAATAASTAASALERAPDKFSDHLDRMTQATGDVAAAQRQLVSAAGDASQRIADALQDGAGQVRSSLTDVSATANNYTGRLERAADILGQAHEAISDLPGAISEMPKAVSALRGDVASLHADVAQVGSRISDLTTAIASARAAVPEPGEWSAPFQTVADDLRKSAEDLRTAAVALQRAFETQALERQMLERQTLERQVLERQVAESQLLGRQAHETQTLQMRAPERQAADGHPGDGRPPRRPEAVTVNAGPASTGPAHTSPAYVSPADTGPAHTSPARLGPAEAVTVENDTVETGREQLNVAPPGPPAFDWRSRAQEPQDTPPFDWRSRVQEPQDGGPQDGEPQDSEPQDTEPQDTEPPFAGQLSDRTPTESMRVMSEPPRQADSHRRGLGRFSPKHRGHDSHDKL